MFGRRSIGKCVCTIALVLSTALPSTPRDLEKELSFKGYLQGSLKGEIQGQPPSAILVEGSDTGLSGELGAFKLTYRFTITLQPGSGPSDPATSAGSAEWVVASGDTIYTKFVGIGEATDTPGISRIAEFYEVVGGTGKFAGAQGQFSAKRLSSSDLTSGSVEGMIVLPRVGH